MNEKDFIELIYLLQQDKEYNIKNNNLRTSKLYDMALNIILDYKDTYINCLII
ncbi:MAG: hypothetical protein IKZ35_01300 [Clostridia bacterium]|nr:hypothetical protein [Clostridia bacterium]